MIDGAPGDSPAPRFFLTEILDNSVIVTAFKARYAFLLEEREGLAAVV